MNIVVLAGGTSTERDVSIVTSVNVTKSLRRNGHKANIIDVFFGTDKYRNSIEFFNDECDLDEVEKYLKSRTKDVKKVLKERETVGGSFFGSGVLEMCKAADIVFMGLHGANGEDGKIQAAFDLLGIRYTGTGYLSSAISMNKEFTKRVLVAQGVPMPKGTCLRKGHRIEYVPFPCVVKPCCGGSSVGVSIANNESEFEEALEEAFSYEDEVLIEEFIKGREFSVAVIDGKALPVIEIEPVDGFYDYQNKYNAGAARETCPADIPAEISDAMMHWAEEACQIVGIETYARVDMLLNEEQEIYCLEINSLPGMTGTSLIPQEAKAVGISYDELTEKIISISMAKYN